MTGVGRRDPGQRQGQWGAPERCCPTPGPCACPLAGASGRVHSVAEKTSGPERAPRCLPLGAVGPASSADPPLAPRSPPLTAGLQRPVASWPALCRSSPPADCPCSHCGPPHSKSCWSCVPFSFWKYSEASQALGGAPKALSHLRGPPPLPDRPPPSRESSFRPRRKGPRLYRAPGQREDRSLLFPTPSSTSRHRTPRIPGLLRAPPLGGRRHHLIGQRREGGGQGSVSDRRRPSSGGAQVVRSPGRRSLCSPLRCPGKTPPTWRSAGQAGPSAAPHTLPGAPGGRMWTRLRRKPAPATGPQMVREAREGGPGSW